MGSSIILSVFSSCVLYHTVFKKSFSDNDELRQDIKAWNLERTFIAFEFIDNIYLSN